MIKKIVKDKEQLSKKCKPVFFKFKGNMDRRVQHEIDHLNGVIL